MRQRVASLWLPIPSLSIPSDVSALNIVGPDSGRVPVMRCFEFGRSCCRNR